jgi:hypothetical protein
MSAFIVNRNHINFLVIAAMSRRIVSWHGPFAWTWAINRETGTYLRGELACNDWTHATEVGQMLWNENIKSVSARYPNDAPDNLPGPCGEDYLFKIQHLVPSRPMEPVAVLKACDCFEYQSCEHDGWESSEAKAFIESLRSAAWHALPGYDDADWEISKPALVGKGVQ